MGVVVPARKVQAGDNLLIRVAEEWDRECEAENDD
jgi:hypothetical protein